MRAKIESQPIAPPSAANRPRTPARGLTIVRPRPVVAEKPGGAFSSRLLKLPRHRLVKHVRFIACEATVVAVLVLAVALNFPRRAPDDSLSLLLNVVAVAAAVAAIVVPIVFYGLPTALTRKDR